MAHAASVRRGQPVAALTTMLVGWVIARAVLWTPIIDTANSRATLAGIGRAAPPERVAIEATSRKLSHLRRTEPAGGKAPAIAPVVEPLSVSNSRSTAEGSGYVLLRLASAGSLIQFNPAVAPPRTTRREPPPAPPPAAADPTVPVKDDPRWSSERWLLMRRGSGAAAQAPGAASYGASQAGAVARYRFGSGGQDSAYGYLRTSLAINAPGKDKEIAIGLGGRPLAKLPLRVLAEARLQDTSQSPTRVRPVVTVVTELPWHNLPLGFRAEAYGQAGYAGGRDSTAFFDAQGLADHPVKRLLPIGKDLRVGAGFWAGGQKGAVRLDVGPRVSFALDLGEEVPSRIALDWRFRVAGNARPGSGPAITVASSF